MLVNDTPSDIAVKVTPQPRKSSISILMNPPEPVVTPSPPAVSGNYEMKQKSVSPTSGLPKREASNQTTNDHDRLLRQP